MSLRCGDILYVAIKGAYTTKPRPVVIVQATATATPGSKARPQRSASAVLRSPSIDRHWPLRQRLSAKDCHDLSFESPGTANSSQEQSKKRLRVFGPSMKVSPSTRQTCRKAGTQSHRSKGFEPHDSGTAGGSVLLRSRISRRSQVPCREGAPRVPWTLKRKTPCCSRI